MLGSLWSIGCGAQRVKSIGSRRQAENHSAVRDLAYASGKSSRESQRSSYKLPERKDNSFLLRRDQGTP
jgi:hypothetical protein